MNLRKLLFDTGFQIHVCESWFLEYFQLFDDTGVGLDVTDLVAIDITCCQML